jgi:hypothetical protein
MAIFWVHRLTWRHTKSVTDKAAQNHAACG